MIDHKTLVIGKKYQLNHGIGELIGLEAYRDNGTAYLITDFSKAHPGSRFIFELDPNAEWCAIMKGTRYAAWGDQIKELYSNG